MSSRNALLLATLAVVTLTASTSSWGQTSKSPSDLPTSQEDSSTQVENKTNAESTAQSSADPVQALDASQVKVAKRSQRLPLSRPYRSYLPNYRSSRAYYPLSGHYNFFGRGLTGGYNLGTRWGDPNYGNHGSFNSGYNFGPMRANPNFGNSW